MVRLGEIEESFSHARPNGEAYSTIFVSMVSGGSDFVELLGAGQQTTEQLIHEFLSESRF